MTTVIDRLSAFMSEKGLNDNVLTEKAKLSVGQIGKAKANNTGLRSDTIEKILYAFPELNPTWLMTGRGPMLNQDVGVDVGADVGAGQKNKVERGKSDVRADVRTDVRVGDKNKAQTYPNMEPQLRTLIHTVDNAGRENILLVPVKAQAGYLVGSAQHEYIESLPTFWLPGLKNGIFRAFEIAGYSMLVDRGVGFNPGDIVIGELVENLQEIRDGMVYVIVNNAPEVDNIVFKRCLNRVDDKGAGVIWCKSDNRDFPMFPLAPDQIKEVWRFRRKITAQAPDPSGIYERLNDHEVRLATLEDGQKKLLK